MKKIFPHVFVFLTFCLTMSLAIWQVQRLQWKEDLIARLDRNLSLPPVSSTEYTNIDQEEFRLLKEHGHYDVRNEMHVLLQSYNGKVGTHVITPFITDTGKTILVNRGWVPNEEAYKEPEIGHELYGVIRKNPRKGYFALENEPKKSIWYNIDLPEMYANLDAPDADYYVEAKALDEKAEMTYPIPLPKKIDIYNEHLQYVITWFGMSIALLAVYYFRFFHKAEKPAPKLVSKALPTKKKKKKALKKNIKKK